MTTTAPFTRIATFHAGPGDADRLAEALLRAATIVADAPGCELWLVQSDQRDLDTVRVCELWSSREQCDAALTLPGVHETAAEVMQLVDRAPDVVDGNLLVAPGSAREFTAGDDGLELVAFGPHSPGDGEMVTDWAPA